MTYATELKNVTDRLVLLQSVYDGLQSAVDTKKAEYERLQAARNVDLKLAPSDDIALLTSEAARLDVEGPILRRIMRELERRTEKVGNELSNTQQDRLRLLAAIAGQQAAIRISQSKAARDMLHELTQAVAARPSYANQSEFWICLVNVHDELKKLIELANKTAA